MSRVLSWLILAILLLNTRTHAENGVDVWPIVSKTSPSRTQIVTMVIENTSLVAIPVKYRTIVVDPRWGFESNSALILDVLTTNERRVLYLGPSFYNFSWLDDQRIFACCQDGAAIIDVPTGKATWLIRSDEVKCIGTVFPNEAGNRFAVEVGTVTGDEPSSIRILDETGMIKVSIPNVNSPYVSLRGNLVWDETGEHLFFEGTSTTYTRALYDFDLSKPTQAPTRLIAYEKGIDAPDSRYLYFLSEPRSLVWKSSIFQQTLILDLETQAIKPLSWALGEDDLMDMKSNRRDTLSMRVEMETGKTELRTALPQDLDNGAAWDVVCDDNCAYHEWLDPQTLQIARYHQDHSEFIWYDMETNEKTTRMIDSLRSIKIRTETK